MISSKVKASGELSETIKRVKSQGKKIVFTNGCFDILHAGHIKYLSKAKSLGDLLVVGLNSDSSVRKIKGSSRPVNNQSDRALALSALYLVDYVTIFGEDTPIELIKKMRPDVLVKGGDWKKSDIVGSSFVKSYGGRVVTIPFLKGYSTTGLIKRLKSAGRGA